MADQNENLFLKDWRKRLKKAAQWNDDEEITKLTHVLENYIYLKNIRPLKENLHSKLNFIGESLELLPIYRKWFSEMSTFISFIRVAQNFKSKDFKEYVTRKMKFYDAVTFSVFDEREKLKDDASADNN